MTVRRVDRIALAIALVALAYLFFLQSVLASRVIDGTRYFWLDDDMMISMRYGRNLAEGHGLVWNPGDRVEGYTNFLWTVLMAGVHLTRVSDAHAAVAVRVVGYVLLGASFGLGLQLLRLFAPRPRFAGPLLLVCMFMCPDVVLWSAWGFEQSLLTFLTLLFLVRFMTRGPEPLGMLALALVPLTRGDGVFVYAAFGLCALFMTSRRRATFVWLAVALLPTVGHLVFRRLYYGDWLPNTYYLKVHGLEAVRARGWAYGRAFLLDYRLLIALGMGSSLAVLRRDRRGVVLFVMVPATVVYVLTTGGDMYGFFRFFAHLMPVLFVFATAGLATLARGKVGQLVWGVVLFVVAVPLLDPFKRLVSRATNGDPDRQVQVAMLLKKNALPDSKTAVFCAGIVPYFTRLPVIDMLGKSDRHIAHLPAFPGSMIGHGKVDPDYTLGQNPDLVVTCSTNVGQAERVQPGAQTHDPMVRFVSAASFRDRYLSYPIMEKYLLAETSVYTHAGSKEAHRRSWTETIEVGPSPF